MRCNNEDCLHEFELFQQSSERPKKKCPQCGKMKLQRLISACHGYVAAAQGDMKKVGDLANFNRDKMSKWEKERADKEYGENSTLGQKKLIQEKAGDDGSFLGASKAKMKKIAALSPEQAKKYVKTGDL
jgi:putative FmdB family regulatory protein